MTFTVTAEQRNTFQHDSVVKLPRAIEANSLNELNQCFDWAIEHPGPILFRSGGRDSFTFVDYANPENRTMYEKAIANSPFGRPSGVAFP